MHIINENIWKIYKIIVTRSYEFFFTKKIVLESYNLNVTPRNKFNITNVFIFFWAKRPNNDDGPVQEDSGALTLLTMYYFQ